MLCSFFFIFNRFVTLSENVKGALEISSIFRRFFLLVTWFYDFFQISELHPKPYTGRHIRAIFPVNRSSDSLEISVGEKKTEKANLQKSIYYRILK